ncbi:MAG TPA: hypothetical protein VLX56_07520 [Nitrososphaerales archaeon]|nr:hypothetical protein [Nitrososphaerales archaeon]
MADIMVLVWKKKEAVGDPDVEVRIPARLAKFVPRMMAFIPKKEQVDLWGENADFGAMVGNLEQLVNEATAAGETDLMEVKTKDSHVKVFIRK